MNDTHHPVEPADEQPSDAPEPQVDTAVAALLGAPSTWAEPTPELADRVVGAVRSEAMLGAPDPLAALPAGRRRPWARPALLGAAAAIMFLFGGIVLLSALADPGSGPESFSAELTSTGLLPDVGGDVDVTSFDSGLQIELRALGLPRRADGNFYQGWVRTNDGDLVPVGTFHDGDGVTLWAGVELARVDLFTITLESAAAEDLAQRSSGDVVLRTELRP